MAHDNPIIVFVVPASFGKRAEEFPMGWRMRGVGDIAPLSAAASYTVLLLDDTSSVSDDIVFANRDREEPLFVVAHNSSAQNSIADIQANPVLNSWGRPYVCEAFSHLPDHETWKEIRGLLHGELDPNDFANERRERRELDLYDQLAAICQLKLIDPAANVTMLQRSISGELPFHFQNDFAERSWSARLELVRERATLLAR
jgi:hypothetical protein